MRQQNTVMGATLTLMVAIAAIVTMAAMKMTVVVKL